MTAELVRMQHFRRPGRPPPLAPLRLHLLRLLQPHLPLHLALLLLGTNVIKLFYCRELQFAPEGPVL
jgi:hypothetical protein